MVDHNQQRIRVLSDIHFEFYDDPEFEAEFYIMLEDWINLDGLSIDDRRNDILILAGDICTVINQGEFNTRYTELINYFKSLGYINIVLVAGNHEFYSSYGKHDEVIDHLENMGLETGIHFLNRNSITINGIKISGCTLWSNISQMASRMTNDCIKSNLGDGNIGRARFLNSHYLDRDYLLYDAEVKESDIIVTHYLPSTDLINEKYKNEEGNEMNTAFATDVLENMNLDQLKVKLLVYGHTHDYNKKVYKSGQKEILTMVNPLGYPGESKLRTLESGILYL